MPERFKNPPLVELVAELRWSKGGLMNSPEGAGQTLFMLPAGQYEEFFMRFGSKIGSLGYDRLERIVPSGFPAPPIQVTYRFRKKSCGARVEGQRSKPRRWPLRLHRSSDRRQRLHPERQRRSARRRFFDRTRGRRRDSRCVPATPSRACLPTCRPAPLQRAPRRRLPTISAAR
jgi:hypothetical protein